jgi:hypothetical protein
MMVGAGQSQTNRFGEYSTVAFSDDVVDTNTSNELHYA